MNFLFRNFIVIWNLFVIFFIWWYYVIEGCFGIYGIDIFLNCFGIVFGGNVFLGLLRICVGWIFCVEGVILEVDLGCKLVGERWLRYWDFLF